MMHSELVKPGERLDDLQCRGYHIIQNPETFCFGMDAVLLADFATGYKKGRAIDLGTGTGVIPLLMEGRGKCAHYTGLEIQEYSADMAPRSVAYNNLSEKIESEEHCLVGRIRAGDLCIAYDSALDKLHDACDLAELALKVEAVTFIRKKDYVSLALVKCLHECCNINVV